MDSVKPGSKLELLLVLLTLSLMLAFCPAVAAADSEVINFGVERFGSEEVMNRSYGPLIDYLQERTGHQFIINYFNDDNEISSHLREGRVQLAHVSSQLYAQALIRQDPNILYLATVSDSASEQPDYYHGYIFTLERYGVKSLEDLRGKSFAFVNRSSSSGYAYPLTMLLQNGIEPETFFSQVLFLGGHPEVTSAVLEQNVYAGATYDANYRSAQEAAGGGLQIILKTPPIPNEPWVASSSLTPEFRSQLQELLLGITPETRLADGTRVISKELREELEIDSFTLHEPAFYQAVVDMLRYTAGK